MDNCFLGPKISLEAFLKSVEGAKKNKNNKKVDQRHPRYYHTSSGSKSVPRVKTVVLSIV